MTLGSLIYVTSDTALALSTNKLYFGKRSFLALATAESNLLILVGCLTWDIPQEDGPASEAFGLEQL